MIVYQVNEHGQRTYLGHDGILHGALDLLAELAFSHSVMNGIKTLNGDELGDTSILGQSLDDLAVADKYRAAGRINYEPALMGDIPVALSRRSARHLRDRDRFL